MLVETGFQEIVDRILHGNCESLTEEERLSLKENKQKIIPKLISIFSKEISHLTNEKEFVNSDFLYWGLKLSSFLKASETFEWFQKLCRVSPDRLDTFLGEDFITEELPFLLAEMVKEDWSPFKNEIENHHIDIFIRLAFLNGLVYAVAIRQISREEVIDYFKDLLHKALAGEIVDVEFITHIVNACIDLWPGECIEEIRELFGIGLVDTMFVNISDVLDDFSLGKGYCLEKLKNQVGKYNFFGSLDSYEIGEKITYPREDFFENTESEINLEEKKPKRNEDCYCGSKIKFKKCCMKKVSLDRFLNLQNKKSTISYEPLEYSDELKILSQSERDSILSLYSLVFKNPEEVIEIASNLIKIHPNIPLIYNFLYSAYFKKNQIGKAMEILRKIRKMFPDYFYGLSEYARYYVRRGEPEKAHEVLKNAISLSELYPNRTVFHFTEWKAFAYILALIFLQKKDINQAKIYLNLLKKIDPQGNEIRDIEGKINQYHFKRRFKKNAL